MKRNLSTKPRWSVRSLTYAATIIMALSVFIALYCGDRPLWIELETVTTFVWVFLLILYWWILFFGVRLEREEGFTNDFVRLPDRLSYLDIFEVLARALADLESTFGLVMTLAIIIPFLLWLGVNIFLITIFMVAFPVFLMFKASLGFVLRHRLSTRGNVGRSALWAFVYASSKALILYITVYLSHLVHLFALNWDD